MTQEEKAKAYDEALKWMRELYPGLHGATKEDAEHYFPELRESEDERIRRELIEYLRGDLDDITTDDTDRWISWLEKQKEQKPEYPFTPDECIKPAEWSEEDDATIKSAVHWLEKYLSTIRAKDVSSATQDGILTVKTTITNLKSLRPRPSWKPSEEQMSSLKQARDYYMSGCIKYVGRHLSEIVEQLEKL